MWKLSDKKMGAIIILMGIILITLDIFLLKKGLSIRKQEPRMIYTQTSCDTETCNEYCRQHYCLEHCKP